MSATIYSLSDTAEDRPVPMIHRKRIWGDKMLMAHVVLEKGCHVATHQHESEQIACVMSGKVKWRLGEPGSPEYREEIAEGGQVAVLPSNFPHGVDALEETVIIDFLSPPGDMGIDNQGRAH